MNVLKLEDVREDLINYLKSRSLLPVIGSGFTVNEKALNGIVPSGETFKNHMLNELKTSKELSNEDINSRDETMQSQSFHTVISVKLPCRLIGVTSVRNKSLPEIVPFAIPDRWQ